MKDHFSRAFGLGFVIDDKFYDNVADAKKYLVETYGLTQKEAREYILDLFGKRG